MILVELSFEIIPDLISLNLINCNKSLPIVLELQGTSIALNKGNFLNLNL